MKKKYFFAGCLSLLVISYLVFFVISTDEARKITREDGIIETLSAVFYFLATIITAILYFKAKTNRQYLFRRNRNILLLLLALFLFLCLGEEISWGQRIFGIGTPERLQEVNAQDEMNLHNLRFFHSFDENWDRKRGIQQWFTAVRIYDYIWILYCFLIPILNKYSSRLHNFFRKLYLPVIPIWIGILFFTNFVFSKLVKLLLVEDIIILNQPVTEMREINFAFLYFIAVVSLFYTYKPLGNLKTIE